MMFLTWGKLVDILPQLLVQQTPVGDDDDRIEEGLAGSRRIGFSISR